MSAAHPPWPDWLPRLEVRGVRIGSGRLDIALVRDGGETRVESLNAGGIQVIRGESEAPLYGAPPRWAER